MDVLASTPFALVALAFGSIFVAVSQLELLASDLLLASRGLLPGSNLLLASTLAGDVLSMDRFPPKPPPLVGGLVVTSSSLPSARAGKDISK